MPETVEGVECKRRGEDRLGRNLDGFRKSLDSLDNVGGAEGRRRNKVCKGEAVKYCMTGVERKRM